MRQFVDIYGYTRQITSPHQSWPERQKELDIYDWAAGG